jgi:hypothetical protein
LDAGHGPWGTDRDSIEVVFFLWLIHFFEGEFFVLCKDKIKTFCLYWWGLSTSLWTTPRNCLWNIQCTDNTTHFFRRN